MKFIYLVLFSLLSSISIAQVPYSFEYSFKYSLDTLSTTSYNNPQTYLLYSDGKVSKFQSLSSFLLDSITHYYIGEYDPKKITNEILNKIVAVKLPDQLGLFSVYKDFKNTFLYTHYNDGPGGAYQCKSPLIINWQFHIEKRIINGIETLKASALVGGREWIVWYAPSIPIPDGPFKFFHTPGLIVRAYDKDQLYFFELISINTVSRQLYKNYDYRKFNDPMTDCKSMIKGVHDFQKNPRVLGLTSEKDKAEIINNLKKEYKTRMDFYIERQ
jgi:GLPGLI family protein